MNATVPIQSMFCSKRDPSKVCSFDLEIIEKPTRPLIHQSARFLLINGGRARIRVQGVEYDLEPGCLVAILPWQQTEVVEVAETLQYYIIVYRYDVVNQAIKSGYNYASEPVELTRALTNSPVVCCDLQQQNNFRRLFFAIRDEMGIESMMDDAADADEPLHGVFVVNQLVELLIAYVRAGRQNAAGFGRDIAAIDPSSILQYMYNHMSEKLTLKSLSKLFYMSESSISNYITRVTGLSFFDLLNEMRVGKTINFLLYTDRTMEELAEILGYVDASHISKVFSARIGTKANEYRKTYQKITEICKIKEHRQAYSIVSYIYQNYAEPLTPALVAAKFEVSVQELQRILLYQVEKNFEDYLNFIRVNRACELLKETDSSILDIAVQVGYNTSKTLTRHFLRQQVMTPAEFRKSVSIL